MYQHMQNRRFLVIFHNGDSEEIDLASFCGFPLSGYSTSMVLWTFQGRFRIKPRDKVNAAMKSMGATDTFISIAPHNQIEEQVWSDLVLEEAAEVVVACNKSHGIMVRPAQVAECFLYMLELCCRGSHSIDYDLATHGANYWVCDSIIHHQLQLGDGGDDNSDGPWRAAHALQREMPLDMDHHQYLSSPHLPRFIKSKPYWTSPKCGFTRILDGLIHNGDIFQDSFGRQLGVLKLSGCTIDFQSPPFVCCHGLRFLWLDHCQGTSRESTARSGKEDIHRFFRGLWVLDVRYTDCDQILSKQMLDLMTQLQELNVIGAKDLDMGLMQGRLSNIRKLRVTKSSICCSCPGNNISLEMDKMELLELSGNDFPKDEVLYMFPPPPKDLSGNDNQIPWHPMPSRQLGLRVSSINSSLETVIIEGCNALKQMSFRGCTKLKNLLLRGTMHVPFLDISGTAVKILDFSATANWGLDVELCILNCEKLCAILWPEDWIAPSVGQFKLLIDTTQSASSARYIYIEDGEKDSSIAATQTAVAVSQDHGNRLNKKEFDWHISVRDARLLFSLESVYCRVYYSQYKAEAYVEVSSPAGPNVPTGFIKDDVVKCGNNNKQQVVARQQRQPAPAVYADSSVALLHQQSNKSKGDAPVIMCMWPCPDPPSIPNSCYIHIQDQSRTKVLTGGEEASVITVPYFVPHSANILHVHDSMSVTAIPSATMPSGSPAEWNRLEWCRVERCPKLKSVFSISIPNNGLDTSETYSLITFWASQLLNVRYICRWNEEESSSVLRHSFPYLMLLHLDYCPRLIHAFPVLQEASFEGLKVIEIKWCGDLKEILQLWTDSKPEYLYFPALKHIHLHELPSLHSICRVQMFTPNLETIKVRGCWSLRRLPDARGNYVFEEAKAVQCDCEKEWWDRLEWDNDSSQPDQYNPIHSRYCKKTFLRSSVLR